MVKKNESSVEKRTGIRLKSELRVYYGPTQQTILSGFSVDLSAGGLFLQTEYPLAINDKMNLIFSLPDHEKSVSCDARVAWVNKDRDSDAKNNDYPSGVGLQFTDLSLEDVTAISGFIENYEVEAAW